MSTIVSGFGDEVIMFLVSMLVVVMSSYLVVRCWLSDGSPQHLHPDMLPAVLSTRDEIGVASAAAVPPPGVGETCPVCLGILEHFVETNCGHRFCAACILEYWHHDQWPHPARCPVCRRMVSRLCCLVIMLC